MWANLLPFAAMIELRLRSIKLLGMRMGPKWLTMKCWGNKQRFDIVLMMFWATASNIFNEDKLLAPVFNRSSRHPEGRGSCERLLLCTPRRVCGKMAREDIKLQQSLLFGSFDQLQGLMFRLGTFALCTSHSENHYQQKCLKITRWIQSLSQRDMSISMVPPHQANFVKSPRPVHGFQTKTKNTQTRTNRKQETKERSNLGRNSLLGSGHQSVYRLMRQRSGKNGHRALTSSALI